MKIPQIVIRNRKPKDRQYHDQKKRDKKTDNDLENNTQKTTEWATRTPLKTWSERMCSRKVHSSRSYDDTDYVILVEFGYKS